METQQNDLQRVETDDGSITFFNPLVQETYHSKTGAKEEAMKKFVLPVLPFLQQFSHITLIDFCFGLGYNTAALLDAFFPMLETKRITIYALENDRTILRKIPEIEAPFTSYPLVQKLLKTEKYQHITLHLLLGDARETLTKVPCGVHCVLFDPFSPKKQPELWSKEIFQALYEKMVPGGMLTTYSCAGQVRRNLKAAGFFVTDGPRVGRRAPATIAWKKGNPFYENHP